ncbi:hypothetical protein BDA96_03G123800 [Sorghum bicolor]|uniref:Uncharacterized protein n=1 Tax=Sorghum bicolor TaxID=4558 RepID=A0A921RDG6_SORBI|nr:hypothetical protein BDA96_03G123800 [Sorghum bicolor]
MYAQSILAQKCWCFSCSWPHSLHVLVEFCNSIMYIVVSTCSSTSGSPGRWT